jgi:hypothetical protein
MNGDMKRRKGEGEGEGEGGKRERERDRGIVGSGIFTFVVTNVNGN